ncbi:MAG: SagB/ThcOx family dehydrogenase [Nitrospiraceae bacterium]
MSDEKPFGRPLSEPVSTDPVDRVIRYHLQTKHHFNRYARSLGFLDWANQPDPFRRFEGAALIPLPLLKPDDEPRSPSYDALYEKGGIPSQPVTVRTISRFLEFALALSAWKRAGDMQWALRSNPSSGNLHPTEGYLVVPQIDGFDLQPGLYHYAPKEHGLELRAEFSVEQTARLLRPLPPSSFLIGLTSIHWREAWKYGERAFRYCNHDVGHAIGSARIAAATLGWKMVLLDAMDQGTVAMLLGVDRKRDFLNAEPEHPDCLAVVWPYMDGRRETTSFPLSLDLAAVEAVSVAAWHGQANRLSRENPVPWEIIDEVAAASWKWNGEKTIVSWQPDRTLAPNSQTAQPSRVAPHRDQTAGQLIRQRRSAVAFDGTTSISSAAFYKMLARVMPDNEGVQCERPVPWDVLCWDAAIHLLLFVHRVDGLTPGLYILARDPKKVPFLKQSMNPELEWTGAPGCPNDLPLYWLLEGDARRLAGQVSCHQDIAADSAFSLGMLAEFEGRLRQDGAWWYPRLFWEAGLVGQVLYLEAEAAGVRATGIGCFFDDPVHEIVGVKNLSIQSLYHFTIGGPVEDMRLMTLPPYAHIHR